MSDTITPSPDTALLPLWLVRELIGQVDGEEFTYVDTEDCLLPGTDAQDAVRRYIAATFFGMVPIVTLPAVDGGVWTASIGLCFVRGHVYRVEDTVIVSEATPCAE